MKNQSSSFYKTGRLQWLAGFTFIALISLIAIQIIWILNAARIEENNFSHRVSIALLQVKSELGQRAKSCNRLNNYLCGKVCTTTDTELKIKEIDSIINDALCQNNLELKYKFFLIDSTTATPTKNENLQTSYLQNLNGVIAKNGIKIGMQFPERNQFIFAQLKGLFTASIGILIFIGLSFYLMFKLFLRERLLLEQTTDFINNMVHEFQTPITNMRLATNLIKKKESINNDPKIGNYLDIILAENAKMESNVAEILKVASIQESKTVEPIKAHEVIDQTIHQFSLRLTEFNKQITTNFLALNDDVFINREHFKLLMSNLIDNAIKYSNNNAFITVSTANQQNLFVLTIADNGIGMQKKELERIFDKYYRISTGDLHTIKGFGLGLAYVKQITLLYKGSIDVKSEVNVGTTFTIKFPSITEK